MHSSQPINETIILDVKGGINLDNAASGADSSSSSAAQAFFHLTNTVKAQQGFIRQYWGHQVEDPTMFVWSIDWETFESHTGFTNAEEYKTLMADLSQAFDTAAAAPLIIYTRFTSDTTAAFTSPVTEVAFLTLPAGAGEETQTAIDEATTPIGKDVKAVGKSWGSATGWVFETKNHATPTVGESIALYGLFGYASIEDHMRWRETPEHAQAIEIMEDITKRYGLKDANVKGKSMFHVKFHAGT